MRGIHQQDSLNHLKDMLRSHDISMLAILEPKSRHSELPQFGQSIGFLSWLHGGTINTHIWILWKQGITIEPLWVTDQAITVRVATNGTDDIISTLVYASCLKRIRARLWDHLDEVAARVDLGNDAWTVTGDFNIIANAQEKHGGRDADVGAIQDFQECSMRNGLIDAGFLGGSIHLVQ